MVEKKTVGIDHLNIILIGDTVVGKTSLTKVRSGKGFSENTLATMGVDYDEFIA